MSLIVMVGNRGPGRVVTVPMVAVAGGHLVAAGVHGTRLGYCRILISITTINVKKQKKKKSDTHNVLNRVRYLDRTEKVLGVCATAMPVRFARRDARFRYTRDKNTIVYTLWRIKN